MRPNFESPVHTARDLAERDITLFLMPASQEWREWLSHSDIPEYRKIGENTITTKSWTQYTAFTKNEMLTRGTHAMMVSNLDPYELVWATELEPDQGEYKYNHGRGYYRGEGGLGDNPNAGYLTNKKWHLNEVFYIFKKYF